MSSRHNGPPDDRDTKDTATRLLSWMSRVQPDAVSDLDAIASQITIGLCEITDCQRTAILVRDLPGHDLLLLSDSQAESETADSDEAPSARLASKHLLAVLPEEPFLVAQATPQLQTLIGQVNGFVDQSSQTLVPGSLQKSAAMPVLVVPLHSVNVAGVAEVLGMALMWDTNPSAVADRASSPLLQAVATQAGGWLATALRMERLSRSYRMLAGVFADAVDARDTSTSASSRAVAYYASLIARELALPPLHIARIEIAGLLHHIGKLTVPDAILQKQVPLTADERELVRSSIVQGAAWLNDVEGLQEIAEMIRHQGENYDGTGYPDQLSGVEIPVGARVLAVARRFTAMTSRRSERRPLSVVGGGLESVSEEAGSTFDPRVVNAFLAAMGRRV